MIVSVRGRGDVRLSAGAQGLLAAFNGAGIVTAADTQVARRLGRLCQESDDRVLLAAALAVRAARTGSVCVQLADLGDLATPEVDVLEIGESEAEPILDPPTPLDAGEQTTGQGLPWPEPAAWLQVLRSSPMVHSGDGEPTEPTPLRLVADRLYLDRYARDEQVVGTEIDRRAATATLGTDPHQLEAALLRWFPRAEDARQREAAAAAATGLITVLTGGPGTGKTTTITRLLAVAHELSPGLRVALAAPTGKAAARLTEALAEQLATLTPLGLPPHLTTAPPAATTLHRLLGHRPGSSTRFRHDATSRLPHDLVVVDEASMVSLPLMARLLEALRPQARLVLVGDPDQLSSVDAGAVLADLVARLRPGNDAAASPVVRLDVVHRFGGAIAACAEAIRAGDADAVLAALRAGGESVRLLEPDAATGRWQPAHLGVVREEVVTAARRRVAAAEAGDAAGALTALASHRVLVAHRRGPYGLSTWADLVREWETELRPATSASSPGTALLVAANDRSTGLSNGDTGVVLPGPGEARTAVFGHPSATIDVPVHRLVDVEQLYALTVHRSQGSQFDAVTLVLPPPGSPLLTRELLYTALTRARQRVLLLGSAESVAAAVARPVRRASGLRERSGDQEATGG